MSTRVKFNSQNGIGKSVAEFVNEVQIMLAKGRRVQAQLNSISSGSDWTAVEAEIGGMTVGTGQTFWTILATAMGSLDSAAVGELARLDQG